MGRLVFWLVVLALGWVMLSGTMPIPGIADEEVVFATSPPVGACGASGCLAVYTLELANVGRSPQESVKVRLRADALGASAIAPTLRRVSGVTTVQPAGERNGVDAYPLGRLDADERVALVFALRSPSQETTAGWERLLVGVEPGRGSARPGEPGALTAGRIVHATGRLVDRLVRAVRAAIAG
ncbi:MAG: hypothetical protein ACREQL_08180 [Candidatus Binatia bacterium]